MTATYFCNASVANHTPAHLPYVKRDATPYDFERMVRLGAVATRDEGRNDRESIDIRATDADGNEHWIWLRK